MATFDADGFCAALDAHRTAAGYTWRDVAREAGVSPSTLTRLGQGKRPDMTSFAALVDWLGLGADTFINRPGPRREVEPLAAAVAILHTDPRLNPKTAASLAQILSAAYEALADPTGDDR